MKIKKETKKLTEDEGSGLTTDSSTAEIAAEIKNEIDGISDEQAEKAAETTKKAADDMGAGAIVITDGD